MGKLLLLAVAKEAIPKNTKGVISISTIKSIDVARAALAISLTQNKSEETSAKMGFRRSGITATAFSISGDFIPSIQQWIASALEISKTDGIICGSFADSGAVVGATREALAQVMPKAVGLNIAGKIGIAYCNENLAVAVLIGIGLMDLSDVAVGLGHRAVERVTEHS
ncbi:MAG: hypothetical protein DDT39_01297 [Firmicutes bacterium]|nr:hypothetical protein [candidate division NPL-UPA2 bacterium]